MNIWPNDFVEFLTEMRLIFRHFQKLIFIAAFSIGVTTQIADAQVIKSNSLSEKIEAFVCGQKIDEASELKQKAGELNELALRMVAIYRFELRFTGGCKDSRALYKGMLGHVCATVELVTASQKGGCEALLSGGKSVSQSVCHLENLREKAIVSMAVSRLIDRSYEIKREALSIITKSPSNSLNGIISG